MTHARFLELVKEECGESTDEAVNVLWRSAWYRLAGLLGDSRLARLKDGAAKALIASLRKSAGHLAASAPVFLACLLPPSSERRRGRRNVSR